MPGLENPGKLLMMAGAILLVVGALFMVGGKLGWLGRLPGDIRIQREGYSFYFPLATSVLLSILLTILFNLFFRRR